MSYLIAHIGHTIKDHEHITWWKPDSKGYTICIDKAGRYEESDAFSICRHGGCIAVKEDDAAKVARSTPYYRRSDGTLNKLYDGGPHRVVPNSKDAWKHLEASKLSCGLHEKPTPISINKTRSIYVDVIPS